jgi:alpha-1,2-mannosyltransferase
MALDPTLATAIFGLYTGVILLLFGLVFYSITPKDKTRLFEQKPFLFLRCAFGALLSTWYCKLPSSLIGT